MQRRASCDSDTSSSGSQEEAQQQCCLTAGHLFLSCCLLIVVMASLLIASTFTEQLKNAQTAFCALLGMGTFLAFISGLLAAFVERKLQEKYTLCRLVYCVTCVLCLEPDERREMLRRKEKESSLCEMTATDSSSSPDSSNTSGNKDDSNHCHVISTPQHFQRNRHFP